MSIEEAIKTLDFFVSLSEINKELYTERLYISYDEYIESIESDLLAKFGL